MGLFTRPFTYVNKKGVKYYLHQKTVTLSRNVKSTVIYFFAKTERWGSIRNLPQGWKIIENRQSGLPILAKI